MSVVSSTTEEKKVNLSLIRLDAERRRHHEVGERLKSKQTELGENEKRLERLQQYIHSAEQQVKDQRHELTQLEADVSRKIVEKVIA